MRRLSAVFFLLLPFSMSLMIAPNVQAGPFGFEKGMSARAVKQLVYSCNSTPPLISQYSDEIQSAFTSTPQKFHDLNFFHTHLLEVSKEVGLYRIMGSSEISSIDLTFNGIPEERLPLLALIRYKVVRDLLKRHYGEYTEHDYLKSDSIFDGVGVQDWTAALDQGDRILLSYWKNNRLAKGGINLIVLQVTGSRRSVSINVTIEFTNIPDRESYMNGRIKKIEAYQAANKATKK